MQTFNSSLTRERFTIKTPSANTEGDSVLALSNRMVLELKDNNGDILETFIVRTQNMHSCVRITARIFNEFNKRGPLLNRTEKWEDFWTSITNDYERLYNKNRWVAVYNDGKCIFKHKGVHPLLDLIEKCDVQNEGTYEDSIIIAEKAFKKTGENIKIEYAGNVALAVNIDTAEARCGVILRSALRTTTFNLIARHTREGNIDITQCLMATAAFLEGIQLSFVIGSMNVKATAGMFARHSEEERKHHDALKRIERLRAEIANLENVCDVHYRPERPIFQSLIANAENLAEQVLLSTQDGGFTA